MEKIQLEAKGTLTGTLADYDLTEALFLVDPATLDVDALQGAGNSEAISLGLMDLELAVSRLHKGRIVCHPSFPPIGLRPPANHTGWPASHWSRYSRRTSAPRSRESVSYTHLSTLGSSE